MADKNRIKYTIEVDTKSSTASIRDLKGQFVATQIPVSKLSEKIRSLDVGLKSFANDVQKASTETDKLRQSTKRYNEELDGSTKSTGAASSAALELGRVVSDMPYGIRGVANNLSQFASNMMFAAKTTGGFMSAVKALWGALSGPLGLLLAIQAVIAALDHFSQSSKKMEKETSEMVEAIGGTYGAVAKMEALAEVMNSTSSTVNQQKEALKELKKMGYDPLNDSIEKFLEQQKELVVLEATSSVFKKQLEEIAKDRLEVMELQKKLTEDFKKNVEEIKKDPDSFVDFIKQGLKSIFPKDEIKTFVDAIQITNIPTVIDDLEKKLKEKAEQFKQNYKEILNVIRTGGDKDSSVKTPKIFPTPEDLELEIKNLDSVFLRLTKRIELEELKNKEKRELFAAETEEEKERIREKYRQRRLDIEMKAEMDLARNSINEERKKLQAKFNDFVESENKKLKKYKESIAKNKKIDKEERDRLIKSASDRTKKVIDSARDSLKKALDSLPDKEKKWLERILGIFDAKAEAPFDKEDDGINWLEEYSDLQKSITNFMSSEFDRQITIEQNKTNAINNELRKRLLDENLAKEERARIQLQIAQNDDKLRLKQEQIEKKKFRMQKAANIAQATIDTYLGANQVLASKELSPFEKFALAAATITKGLLNVAAISRQKFQTSTGARVPVRGTGGADGVGDRSFNFNLVGATQGNQIAQAIQAQFSSPLKAYVVSKDVTTQQELDANIRGGASF